MLFTLLLVLAQAPNPQARLAFTSDAPACWEEALHDGVSSKLGYDPFVAASALGISVSIVGEATLRAQIVVSRPGEPDATRTLYGPADCAALMESVARAVATAVQQLGPTVAVEVPVNQTEPKPMPRASVLVSLGADLGQQPDGTTGMRAGARLGRGRVFTGLVEVVFDFPSRLLLADNAGAIDGLFFGVDGGLCATASLFTGCALMRVGGLHYFGEGIAAAGQGWLPSVSAGARVSIEWPKDTLVAVQASAEARVPFDRLRIFVGDDLVWGQNWVMSSFAAALVVRVP